MALGIAFITVHLRRKQKSQGEDKEGTEKSSSSLFSRHKPLMRSTKCRHPEHIITPFTGRRFSVVHIAPEYSPGTETSVRPVPHQRSDGSWYFDTSGASPPASRASADPRVPEVSSQGTYHRSPRRFASQPDMRTRGRVVRPQSGHSIAPTCPPGICRSPTPSTSSECSGSSSATVEKMQERLQELREFQVRQAQVAKQRHWQRAALPPLPPLPPPPPYTP
ncbi:hypothetical protein GLOTRDRAFT_120660 [Gloeophyllum trabeum ATCC 11539]|uniref:Uncharacterized protein n=1 Tax=Gloeophyllum trabeum (strain ATCC 11539 / FP-39264 / Madison 617) TaxID=670483 RepID=S7QDZ5_GLOTA|nr:uncharacterized protein GLOTRDRAFT_120660 [Gloeophyllum trabeum ATCC 11539]EPQ57513.1 hypothetical protein GLOTRDRAFT_120660 [Gloeophyllum trabeum ATCC 11539]